MSSALPGQMLVVAGGKAATSGFAGALIVALQAVSVAIGAAAVKQLQGRRGIKRRFRSAEPLKKTGGQILSAAIPVIPGRFRITYLREIPSLYQLPVAVSIAPGIFAPQVIVHSFSLIIPFFDPLRVYTWQPLQGRSPISADCHHSQYRPTRPELRHGKTSPALQGSMTFSS